MELHSSFTTLLIWTVGSHARIIEFKIGKQLVGSDSSGYKTAGTALTLPTWE